MYHYIYKITNLLNGKIYIGQHSTDNLDDYYMGSGVMLHKAFKKHGIDNFKKEILRFVNTKEDLDDLERWLVYPEFVKSGDNYNVALGGNGVSGENNPMYGKHHSEETRKKLSESNKGRHPSEETKRKISESQKGKHHSEETLKKMSESHKGKHLSEETRKKLSESHRGSKNGNFGIGNQKGKKWYNNGVVNKLSFDKPEGFTEGKLVKNPNIHYSSDLWICLETKEKHTLREWRSLGFPTGNMYLHGTPKGLHFKRFV